MKKLVSTLLIVFLMVPMIWAQDYSILSVNGHVTDNIGAPIPNHLVTVSVMGFGTVIDYPFFTNETGYYGSDSIIGASQGQIRAGTFDCNGDEHAQEEFYNPGNYSFVFDFAICADSIPNTECMNSFWYESMGELTYEFFGEAFPIPADSYFWDFGDGSTGSGQQASHTYDVNTGELFTVTLSTFSYDPASGDSCAATSSQEVWVNGGGGGDCVADFSYVLDSTPNGSYFVQFTDESIGSPAYWIWDFGDGGFSEDQNPEYYYYENGTYLVCLTIMSDSANNCFDTYCEEIVIGNGGGGSDCENWFWYEQTGNTATVGFYGEAFPYANEFIWDFGDGSTGTGQEIEHTYDPNSGDIFIVTLTTITNDSMNEPCTAVSMQEVWIYNGGGNDCENWFWYDTEDYLTFEFFGESYPMAADYYSWDFGDGTTGNGSEAQHTFDPNNGDIQWVTLTTFSYDPATGDSCTAVSTQEVYVGNGGWNECENFFWYESFGDFVFDFYGEAFPFPADNYTWDFGDGTYGEGQQITHIFDPSQGNEFTVCLTSFSFDPATGDSCIAVSCQEIVISGQSGHELTGTVSMGDEVADFALVGLFGMGDDGSFIYEFTMTVPGTGFYFFENVPNGVYYILATLTPQSPEFTDYFPTYYGNEIFWFDATEVELGDPVNPYDINLVSIENFNAGPGAINGIVTIGNEKGGAAENITVLLMDADENALTYIQSNNEGLFDFSDLEYGTYKLKIEVPGITSEIATVLIDEDNQSMDISFVLKGNSAYLSVNNNNAVVSNISDIYPNPVAGNAKMEIDLLKSSDVNLSIYNQMGQAVYNSNISLSAGKQLIELNTADFSQGVYTINLTDENGKTMRKKFVKTK